GRTLLAAYLSGAAGNLISWIFATDSHPSLGASGMVMGALGLIAIQTLASWRKAKDPDPSRPPRLKHLLSGLIAGLILFILLGLTPGTNILAHFGGFVSGLVFGVILLWPTYLFRNRVTDFLAGILFVGLIIFQWWLALN